LIANNEYGRAYGNLFTLGSLHFAPSTSPATQSLINYMNQTTATFRDLTIHQHTSEKKAVKQIMKNLDERAWALIVLDDDDDLLHPKYTIRMNLTTLPNTNVIVSWISIGLNTQYQRYYTSGFLSIRYMYFL